jgi:hypothetical protein
MLIRRQPGSRVVTRIQSIPPRIGELFYLRALLQHRPAYGFTDLRTVRGRVYTTYQKAAAVLGLFQDKTESEHALQEPAPLPLRPSNP